MIERIKIESDQQWRELRAPNVGASEVAALLGCHEHTTALGLWARKSGRVEADAGDSAAMRRGRKLEPVAVELVAEEFPQWRIERPRAYYVDRELRFGATPDLFAFDQKFGQGIVQIKSVAPSVFRERWRDQDGGGRVPLGYAVQAIAEAYLTGSQWTSVAALVVGFGIDLHIVDVPIHAGILQRIQDELRLFWRRVELNTPPEPDYARDATLIAKLYDADNGSECDLSGDNELPAILDERERAQARAAEAERKIKECNAAIMYRLGEHAIGRLKGGDYVSAKTVNRRPYEVKATSYRSIRVVRRQPRHDAA